MEVLIPISMFAMIAAVVIIPNYFRSRERAEIQVTLRDAVQAGRDLPEEMVRAMALHLRRTPTPQRDIRAGIIWAGVGVGFAALGYAASFEADEALLPALGVASFPFFVGLALIIVGMLRLSKEPK